MAYGHGISLSLLQLARAYTVFARDGELVPLTLVKADGFTFSERIAAAREAVRALREQDHVDAVVMIGHEHVDDDFALADENPRHRPGRRRRDLDRRLVRLDLDERVVLGYLLALRHEPASDLPLGQALAEIRKLKLVGHPLRP